MSVTVISPCWKRFENYEKVLQGWLSNSEVNEIIILDNSGSFETDLPVTVVSVNRNLGPQAKYSLALWAKNDCIIFADDDILVESGIVKDFLKHWDGNNVVGIIGRVFDGESYYTYPDSKGSTGYRGENISEPVKADWLGGGCTMTSRDKCYVDMNECPAMEIDDMWWESHFHDFTELLVIPTNKYKFMEENYDENALHSSPRIKELREKYAKEWGFIK